MAEDKNLEKQEAALGDEELDKVSGGMAKTTIISADVSQTVVTSNSD